MADGMYQYFVDNFFDGFERQFTFDLDTADVRVILCKDYPPSQKHHWYSDIKKYELKRKNISIAAVKGSTPDNITEWSEPCPDEELEWWEDTPEPREKIILKIPNGYHEGGLSVGGVYAKEEVYELKNDYGEVYQRMPKVVLYAKGDKVTWGEKTAEDPARSTLTADYFVYYLKRETPKTSPLIAYIGGNGSYSSERGTFTIIPSPHGLCNILIPSARDIYADAAG
jgi:hypothetical protein